MRVLSIVRARGRIIERDEAAYWELQSSRFPIDGISSTAAFPYCRLDALDFRRIETSESSADERSINPRCSRRRRESRFPDVCRVRRSCLPSLRPSPSQPNPPPPFMARTRHRLKNRLVPYPKRLDRTAAEHVRLICLVPPLPRSPSYEISFNAISILW